MKLNRVEKALMNNPVRSALQWHYEACLLQRLGARVDRFGCSKSAVAAVSVLRSS